MLLPIFVSLFRFGVDADLKFTECQAEYIRNQHGNENVEFVTDGKPCPSSESQSARALTDYSWNQLWDIYVEDG